jgi:hypothetical protein
MYVTSSQILSKDFMAAIDPPAPRSVPDNQAPNPYTSPMAKLQESSLLFTISLSIDQSLSNPSPIIVQCQFNKLVRGVPYSKPYFNPILSSIKSLDLNCLF